MDREIRTLIDLCIDDRIGRSVNRLNASYTNTSASKKALGENANCSDDRSIFVDILDHKSDLQIQQSTDPSIYRSTDLQIHRSVDLYIVGPLDQWNCRSKDL